MNSGGLAAYKQTFRKAAYIFCAALLLLNISPAAHADERRIVRRIAPVYPELAKRLHISGTVRVQATIAPDGNVVDAKAISGNKMLTASAEDAVKHWKFSPSDSQSNITIEVNFDE